jgi:hypothetical protein
MHELKHIHYHTGHTITLCNTGVTFPVPAETATISTKSDSNVRVTVNGVTVTEDISVTAGSVPQECSVKLPSDISAGAVVEVALLVAANSSAHRYAMFNYMKLLVHSLHHLGAAYAV